MARGGSTSGRPSPHVVIIGAGISGILMGIKLLERGISFVIHEKAGDIGGTWRDNNYPGLYCDVPAHTYNYSFAPEPGWSHYYASGPDIQRHYRSVAARYGVLPHIRFDSEMASAEWRNGRWHLHTIHGEQIEADILITAVGRLHHPAYPDIPGLADFAGPVFHSARWRHDVDLAGKRLGVIGTGSSSAQIVVAMADSVERLSLFQRTPHWVLTLPNNPYSFWQKLKFRLLPHLLKKHTDDITEKIGIGAGMLIGDKEDRKLFDQLCHASLATVRDPVLRERLTPQYEVGCKRLIVSPGFYDAVQKPSVDLVTDGIDRIVAEGVVTRDGRLHPLDALVLATGFNSNAYMRPMTVVGENGVSIDEVFDEQLLNYRSVAIPHMPNFFMINGPYAGTSMSIVGLIELQVGFILQCLDRVMTRDIALTPRIDRSRELLAEIRDRAKRTVWGSGGCKSWFLDKEGVPIYNPLTRPQQVELFSKVDFDDFIETPLSEWRQAMAS